MSKGFTSKEFIRRLEVGEDFGDKDIVGIPAVEFIRVASRKNTLSDFTKGLKDIDITEFGAGWGTRMIVELIKMKEFGEIMKLTEVAEGLFKMEKEAPPTPEKKLEMIPA